MKTPNYLFEEFVDNNILNTGFAQILSSLQEFPARGHFFIPGIFNPAGITFAFHANLTVTVNTDSVEMLFGSGAVTDAHGTTNGVDSNSYLVNFTGLVPGIGSITAYIVAQYGQIQLDSTVILGAPGHPDYSANFVPYVGYTRLQDTWNVFTTTSPPDNFTTFELARTTLTVGQTSVISVDTSHQQQAALNINSGLFGIAGDVTGTLAATIVQRSSAATFFANAINAAGNITAAGVTAAGNIIAEADLIAGLDIGAARDVNVTRNVNVGGFVSAVGELFAANATQANAAAMLGQFGGRVSVPGPNFSTYFHISIFDSGTNSVQRVLVEFGNVQSAGGSGGFTAGQQIPVSFPLVYPSLVGTILVSNLSENGFLSSGSIVAGTTSNTGFTYVNNGPNPTVGFTWFAIGL